MAFFISKQSTSKEAYGSKFIKRSIISLSPTCIARACSRGATESGPCAWVCLDTFVGAWGEAEVVPTRPCDVPRPVSADSKWGWDTFRRRVLDPERLAHLPRLQRALLHNGFKRLRRGGYLVYSTCR